MTQLWNPRRNLDFWLPPVTAVVQDFLRGMPVVDDEVEETHPRLTDGTVFDSVVNANPRMGTDLWRGEDEAAEFLQAALASPALQAAESSAVVPSGLPVRRSSARHL
jgi:hypothetical protein